MTGGRAKRADAWGLAAILAAFALIAQVVAPTVATAHIADDRAPNREMCSADAMPGMAGMPSHAEHHHKGLFGLKCADCVVASLAGAAPAALPVPTRVAEAVWVRPSIDGADTLDARNLSRIREQSPRAPPEL
jgi:hypothetical protein